MWKGFLVLAGAGGAVLIGTAAWAQASQSAEPAPPAVVVQKAQLLDPTRLVVTGTIACQPGSTFTVSVNVTELGSQASVRRSPLATGPCTAGGPQAWTATVTGSGGTFAPVLTAFGTITDPSTQKSVSNVVQGGVTFAKA